jgi:hypothetical protein
LKISTLLLVLLAQLSGCAKFLCSLSLADQFRSRRLSIAIPSVQDIAPLSQDDILVAAHPLRAPTAIELTRVRFNQEEKIAATPALFPYDLKPSVFSKEGRWWFSRQGDEGAVSSVFFVTGEGDRIQQTRVRLPRKSPLVWLPIRGDVPRGLEISAADEQPALRIDEVTPAGVRPLAAFPWWESGFQRTLLSSRWSAEALGDGRIAIVAVDGPPEGMALQLRIVGGEKDPVESPIPCSVAIDYPLATAAASSGKLAVVGRSKEGKVVAMIVDVDQPQSTRCRVISEPGEIAAQPPLGTPSVAWTGDSFVTAWIRDDGTIRAGELRNLRSSPLIIDVGEEADVDRPLRQLIHADGETVTFIWKERGGGFVIRRMPRSVAGYAFAAELWRQFCATFN